MDRNILVEEAFPPHARGWTLQGDERTVRVLVSPARAGMDLPLPQVPATCWGFPRTRGDGPGMVNVRTCFSPFPPHARGWTA